MKPGVSRQIRSRGFAAISRHGLIYSLPGPRVKCRSLTLLCRDVSPRSPGSSLAHRGRDAGPCPARGAQLLGAISVPLREGPGGRASSVP